MSDIASLHINSAHRIRIVLFATVKSSRGSADVQGRWQSYVGLRSPLDQRDRLHKVRTFLQRSPALSSNSFWTRRSRQSDEKDWNEKWMAIQSQWKRDDGDVEKKMIVTYTYYEWMFLAQEPCNMMIFIWCCCFAQNVWSETNFDRNFLLLKQLPDFLIWLCFWLKYEWDDEGRSRNKLKQKI